MLHNKTNNKYTVSVFADDNRGYPDKWVAIYKIHAKPVFQAVGKNPEEALEKLDHVLSGVNLDNLIKDYSN